MPRGMYDRKESRIHCLKTEISELKEKVKLSSVELAKKKTATAPGQAAPQLPMNEKFTILRDNLKLLSDARRLLVDSDNVNTTVLDALSEEISSHLKILGSLRQLTFQKEELVEQRAAIQSVPMPSAPQFFQPQQNFQQAMANK